MADCRRDAHDTESSSTIEDPDLYCVACFRVDGQKEEAIGYCKNCKEHLCKACYKTHRRHKLSVNHVLLDQHNMPKSMSIMSLPIHVSSEVPCSKHANKPIEFFCSDHEVVLCSVCSTLDHRHCKIEYIPDYAASYLDSERGKSKLTRIQAILQGCDHVKKVTQGQLEAAERNALQVIEGLTLQRDKIVATIEKEFEDLKDTAVKFRNERRTKASDMLKQCNTIQTNVRGIESTVKDVKSDKSSKEELFIHLMQSHINLVSYESQLKELTNTKILSKIRFSQTLDTSDMSKGNFFLGSVGVGSLSDNTKAIKIREVNVKASVDENRCEICGIETLSNDILAFTDFSNKSVKTVKCTTGEILNVKQLPSKPFDLSAIPDSRLAVSLSDGGAIQFLSTERGLALDDKIPCKPAPRGIVYHKGQLVVSFVSPTDKVEILSLTGDVIRSFSPGLNRPYYVTVSNDSHILISDGWNDRVVKLDWTGVDCGTYTDTDLRGPTGIAVDSSGKFVICSMFTNTVHLVSEKCMKITLLTHVVKGPKVCCYDEKKGLLYFSFASGTYQENVIMVFELGE